MENISKQFFKSRQSPRGPSRLELSDSSASNNFLEFLLTESPKLTQKYGDTIQLSAKQYLITGPNAFKHILKTNPNNYTKRNLTYDRIKHIFGNGLIVSEGPIWEQHRQILQEAFTRDRLTEYATVMTSTTQDFINNWRNQSSNSINLVKEMMHLTLTIAFRVFSNYNPTLKDLQIINFAIQHGTPHISHALFVHPWMPSVNNLLFFWSIRRMNNALQNIITERHTNGKSYGDFLDLLLSSNFNKDEILDEFKTILLTGHETTACGLTWTWHLLSKHPEYRLLLEQELNTVLGDRTPTFDDCASLPMTKAIFLEALRLYPAIWVLPRRVLQSDTIDGYDIPSESQLILNIHALHRNPHYWNNPEQFYPCRFLGEYPSERHTYAFLPFSIGPHSCIGSHFSMVEGILLIATLAQQLRLEALYNKNKTSPKPFLSLRPPNKMPMKFSIR